MVWSRASVHAGEQRGDTQLTRSACWRRYACKTIPKDPQAGAGHPRYLLKLQTEVDAMQQLGPPSMLSPSRCFPELTDSHSLNRKHLTC